MKKIFLIVVLLLFTGCYHAVAEPFEMDENAVLTKMDKSWAQGYEPTVSDGKVTVCLPLISQEATGKITATLVMDDTETSPIKTRKLSKDFWKDDGMYSVVLQYQLISGRINGDYSGYVLLEGKNSEGEKLEQRYPVVIRVRDGKKENAVPEISEVSANIKVGEEGTIEARITNASRYSEMQDVRLTINDKTGDILPQGSNQIVISNLKPGESVEVSYPVIATPKAEASLHTLDFQLSYVRADESYVWTETFTLSVEQEIRLEHGGVEMASSVIQGNMAALTLPLMNMGRGELVNVMTTLSLDGITEGQSVLVGTIEPGETKQAKLSFTAGKDVVGLVEGSVSVTAEDAWGNSSGFTLPTSITVEKFVQSDDGTDASTDAVETGTRLQYVLIGVCAALTVILILQGALLRRKIHRIEEEKL